MKQSITQQLENAYARATMQAEAKHLRGANDWQRVREIQSDSAQAKQAEQETFRADYDARLADAREAVLNERAARHYTHPAPQSAAKQDRFNKDQIERQAHLRVHNAHQKTMAKIDQQERRDVKELMQKNLMYPTHLTPLRKQFQSQSQQIKRER